MLLFEGPIINIGQLLGLTARSRPILKTDFYRPTIEKWAYWAYVSEPSMGPNNIPGPLRNRDNNFDYLAAQQ